VAVAADILSLVKLTSWRNSSCSVGTTQRFGISMVTDLNAAYFATKEEYKRSMPGRIIMFHKMLDGNRALRMAFTYT
jgi:glycine dehydrogenase